MNQLESEPSHGSKPLQLAAPEPEFAFHAAQRRPGEGEAIEVDCFSRA